MRSSKKKFSLLVLSLVWILLLMTGCSTSQTNIKIPEGSKLEIEEVNTFLEDIDNIVSIISEIEYDFSDFSKENYESLKIATTTAKENIEKVKEEFLSRMNENSINETEYVDDINQLETIESNYEQVNKILNVNSDYIEKDNENLNTFISVFKSIFSEFYISLYDISSKYKIEVDENIKVKVEQIKENRGNEKSIDEIFYSRLDEVNNDLKEGMRIFNEEVEAFSKDSSRYDRLYDSLSKFKDEATKTKESVEEFKNLVKSANEMDKTKESFVSMMTETLSKVESFTQIIMLGMESKSESMINSSIEKISQTNNSIAFMDMLITNALK